MLLFTVHCPSFSPIPSPLAAAKTIGFVFSSLEVTPPREVSPRTGRAQSIVASSGHHLGGPQAECDGGPKAWGSSS